MTQHEPLRGAAGALSGVFGLCLMLGLVMSIIAMPTLVWADAVAPVMVSDDDSETLTEPDSPEVQLQKFPEGGYELTASIRIAAPVRVVWDVLKDCGQALRYMPGMRTCEVLEAGPDYDVAKHRIRRYLLLPSVDYVFRSDYHPYRQVDVHLLKGDLRRLEGHWQFASCGSACTELSYDFAVEAGWLVPSSLERKALRKDVPEMLTRLRQQSEESYAGLSEATGEAH